MKKFLISLMASAFLLASIPAEAKYGGSRSISSTRVSSPSSFRPSYSAPRVPSYSAPRVPSYRPSTPTYRSSNTTIINQRSGGGFMSNMFSSMAGVFGGMWLFNLFKGDEKPAQPAVAAPAAPASAPVVTQ